MQNACVLNQEILINLELYHPWFKSNVLGGLIKEMSRWEVSFMRTEHAMLGIVLLSYISFYDWLPLIQTSDHSK